MTILAIDTSMSACSAAVLPAGQSVPVKRFEPMARGHAEAIFPMIKDVMDEAGCGFSVLSKIAVTLGPGSFTGVRAGIAAARGIALAAGCPVVGASSLEVMAAQFASAIATQCAPGGFAIVHDARREEVYLQPFDCGGAALSPPQVLTLENALAMLPPNCATLAGSGAETLASLGWKNGLTLNAEAPALLPEAAVLALLARDREPEKRPPAPLYLRPADAKPQTDKSVARLQS